MGFRNMSFRKHGGGHSNGPLRKVIERRRIPHPSAPDVIVTRELLECGHLVPVKSDFVGPTNAARRRCGKCKLGHPKDV